MKQIQIKVAKRPRPASPADAQHRQQRHREEGGYITSAKKFLVGIGALALIGGLAACGSSGGGLAAPTVTQTVIAPAPAAVLSSVSSMWFSGEYLRCWYGRNAGHNWAEIVPDGTLAGVRTGWGKVYYVGPLYLGEFTVVAPNGVRLTYKPVS